MLPVVRAAELFDLSGEVALGLIDSWCRRRRMRRSR